MCILNKNVLLLAMLLGLLAAAAQAAIQTNYNNNYFNQQQQQQQQQQQSQYQQQSQQQYQQQYYTTPTTTSPSSSAIPTSTPTRSPSSSSSFYQSTQPTAHTQSQTHTDRHRQQLQLQYNKQQQQQDEQLGTRILDNFNHRYPDGSYEFRYELDNGSVRYERGYFLYFDKVKTLVVVGYYAYRMPDNRYITVFYNADQNGYRQNQAITQQSYPNLPRSIDVPEETSGSTSESAYASNARPTTTTTPKPYASYSTTTRRSRF